ncbi:hypothetical protein [Hahella sp. NBU794]|uniref:hypothetical protein n=1 Tax=Hahella sp. NBU794 TaxID=3422590 RepID=UPI003D6FF69E
MKVGKYELPKEIDSLIESGIWPLTDDQEFAQHEKMLIEKSMLSRVIIDEAKIYFYKPPFLNAKKGLSMEMI